MKKILCLILVVTMIICSVSMLTACEQEVAEDTITISRWASVYEQAAFTEWTKAFTEETGIKVQWNFSGFDNYFTKLQYDLLDDAASDVVFLSTWGWNRYSDSNIFVDLDTVDSLKETIASVDSDAASKFLKENGGDRLALAVGITTRRYAINTPEFSEEQLNSIKERTTSYTCEELVNMLGPVTDSIGKKYATKQDSSELAFLLTASAGAPIVNNETKTVDCNTSAGIAAIEELVKYYQSGYTVPFGNDVNGGAGGTFDEAMLTTGSGATVLTSYTGPWAFNSLQNAGKTLYSIAPLKATGGVDTSLVTYNNLCVPKASQKQEMAFKFIEWALSYEAQLEFAKFSDLPANKQAYDHVTGGTDPNFPKELFGAYNIGKDNMYYMDGLSDEFASAYSAALSDLLNPTYTTDAQIHEAAVKFCAAMKAAESKI